MDIIRKTSSDETEDQTGTVTELQQTTVKEVQSKGKIVHKEQITGLQNLNESEVLTCGLDLTFKVWDKHSRQCDYTIESHKTLKFMAITGEKANMLIASLGEGDLMVMGVVDKNQLDIIENAHTSTVVQIVSLSKLKDKYFATRCDQGNVNIWSATNHPDRLFTLVGIDRDDNNNNLSATTQDLSSTDQANISTTATDKDKMIELKMHRSYSTSSTALCISLYSQCSVIVGIIDLKTRKKNIIKRFNTSTYPTYLYQLDENFILVGLDNGSIEQWSLVDDTMTERHNAYFSD